MSGTQASTTNASSTAKEPPMSAADKAAADAEAAAVAAEKSRVEAEKEAEVKAVALAKRADDLEAKELSWEMVHRGPTDITERLDMPGGYLLRSSWRHRGDIGVDPVSGSAVVFVPGDAPALYKKGDAVLLHLDDLNRGVDPETAEMSDVIMTPRIDAASEVLLRLPDRSVRVLKAKS